MKLVGVRYYKGGKIIASATDSTVRTINLSN
jgi:hypothetical protein